MHHRRHGRVENMRFEKEKKTKVYRGDMQKIHVTRQYFESSGRHGDFFDKTKNLFLDKVYGSMGIKFQVSIFSSFSSEAGHKYINK